MPRYEGCSQRMHKSDWSATEPAHHPVCLVLLCEAHTNAWPVYHCACTVLCSSILAFATHSQSSCIPRGWGSDSSLFSFFTFSHFCGCLCGAQKSSLPGQQTNEEPALQHDASYANIQSVVLIVLGLNIGTCSHCKRPVLFKQVCRCGWFEGKPFTLKAQEKHNRKATSASSKIEMVRCILPFSRLLILLGRG